MFVDLNIFCCSVTDVRGGRRPLCDSPGWLLCGDSRVYALWLPLAAVAEKEDTPPAGAPSCSLEGTAAAAAAALKAFV